MNVLKLIAIIIYLLGVSGVSVAKDFDDSAIGNKDYPAWFSENIFMDLTDNLSRIKSDGKKGLMVLFTTEGCSYCAVFIDQSLGDPEIARLVQDNFDSIGMEIFDDTEMVGPQGESLPIKVFAKQEGVMFSPTLVFYDPEGKQIFRKTGYLSTERFRQVLAYVIGDHYTSETYASYASRIEQEKTPVVEGIGLLDNPHFDEPPYALDRSRLPASEPLLVLFEKNNCVECTDFHEVVLRDQEVSDTLNGFQVVRLDADDDKTPIQAPGGQSTTPAEWYLQAEFSRVPAMILVDPNGNEAIKTDALVLKQRMMNSLNYMLEEAYEKGWTYQRFARSKAIARSIANQQGGQSSTDL
jgi:thioredoxin-related protein